MIRLFFAATAAVLSIQAPAHAANYGKPNIIVVMTDDQTVRAINGRDASGKAYMPFVMSKIGTSLQLPRNYFAMPVCGPSRSTFLTGKYPHNHGITFNIGAYDSYMQAGLDQTSLGKLLHDAGYYTGIYGKFLNDYPGTSAKRPAGWSGSLITEGWVGDPFHWTGYRNGNPVTYAGATDATYMTNVLANEVISAIRQQANYKRPFALVLSPFAPHLPAIPAKEFAATYLTEPLASKKDPSFNELDKSDKPTYVQSLPYFTPAQISTMTLQWRRTLQAARSVDKAFQRIWVELETSGRLADTYIVFMSDNGLLWGQHGLLPTKLLPYAESSRSTMYVWGPQVAPRVDYRIVSNADLLPTFLQIASAPVPPTIDGRSLLPLFTNQAGLTWRKSFLVRGYTFNEGAPEREFRSLATNRWMHTFYKDGEREFYDYEHDPYELSNLAGSLLSGFINPAELLINNLYACAGRAICQPLEDAALPTR
jgi:N-acetylglucosamine-6-sulfatase